MWVGNFYGMADFRCMNLKRAGLVSNSYTIKLLYVFGTGVSQRLYRVVLLRVFGTDVSADDVIESEALFTGVCCSDS